MGNTSGRPAPHVCCPHHLPFSRAPLCVDREVVGKTGGGWRGEAERGGAADLPGSVCRTCASCSRGIEATSSPRFTRATWQSRSMRIWNGLTTVERLRDEPLVFELGHTQLDYAGARNINAAEPGLERRDEFVAKHRLGCTSPFRRVPPQVRGRRKGCRSPRHHSRC